MSEPVWCPHCRFRSALGKFPNNWCPQCRKKVEPNEVIRSDPYQPKIGTRQRSNIPPPKKFLFDQKGGSGREGGIATEERAPIKSVPTETLGFYKRDK